MEEVIGSIPIRSTKQINNLSHYSSSEFVAFLSQIPKSHHGQASFPTPSVDLKRRFATVPIQKNFALVENPPTPPMSRTTAALLFHSPPTRHKSS